MSAKKLNSFDDLAKLQFNGETQELKAFAKAIKNELKVGGTVKNGEILIQGNFRDKIIVFLKGLGHVVKRVGG